MQTKEELLKVAKPILFNTEMVKAILDDRKTQTRRLAKGRNFIVDYVPPTYNHAVKGNIGDFFFFEKHIVKNKWKETINFYDSNSLSNLSKLMNNQRDFLFNIGDILFVKETFAENFGVKRRVVYKADFNDDAPFSIKWKPSIHMPKKYARIFLRVTDARVENLQDISEEDCLKEGVKEILCACGGHCGNEPCPMAYNISHKEHFMKLWDSVAKDGYKWKDNRLITVNEFELIALKD